jgi:glyoxylase-like metal-dependent hydrolase (beta-lactamase superfamily II)
VETGADVGGDTTGPHAKANDTAAAAVAFEVNPGRVAPQAAVGDRQTAARSILALARTAGLGHPRANMKLGEPIDRRSSFIRRVHDLDEPRALGVPGPRLEALRTAARALGDALRSGPKVVGVKTLENTTLPYPTRYAFNGTVPLPWPFVTMTHRTLLVVVETSEGTKNILFNPTDPDASRQTPFFAKLSAKVNAVAPFAEKLLAKRFESLEAQLSAVGLSAEQIDVIAFDHFHTQDLRPIMGTSERPGRFPNALLLAPRNEWQEWDGLHPMQRPWFIAEGRQGVAPERVVLFDGDLSLGDGCLLLRTPGHTCGNQTLFVHGDEGVFGCSENGTSADNWSPHASSILGMRRYAEYYELDAVLNSNTPEMGGEQYTSMMVERSLVDPVPGREQFVQMFPSSEVTPSIMAPGIIPSMVFGHRDGGRFARH